MKTKIPNTKVKKEREKEIRHIEGDRVKEGERVKERERQTERERVRERKR